LGLIACYCTIWSSGGFVCSYLLVSGRRGGFVPSNFFVPHRRGGFVPAYLPRFGCRVALFARSCASSAPRMASFAQLRRFPIGAMASFPHNCLVSAAGWLCSRLTARFDLPMASFPLFAQFHPPGGFVRFIWRSGELGSRGEVPAGTSLLPRIRIAVEVKKSTVPTVRRLEQVAVNQGDGDISHRCHQLRPKVKSEERVPITG